MVKLLIKMAAAVTAGEGKGSGVLTKLIEELQEAEVAMEVRFKIDQAHPDVEGCGALSSNRARCRGLTYHTIFLSDFVSEVSVRVVLESLLRLYLKLW
jgi:hypothetical protein